MTNEPEYLRAGDRSVTLADVLSLIDQTGADLGNMLIRLPRTGRRLEKRLSTRKSIFAASFATSNSAIPNWETTSCLFCGFCAPLWSKTRRQRPKLSVVDHATRASMPC